jgi:hypothetical protein
MMLSANQDFNSVFSTRKVAMNKLNGPPDMQQVVYDKAGTRFTLHLSYVNRRISVPTEVGTRDTERERERERGREGERERERSDGAPARQRDKSRSLYPKVTRVVELVQMYR